MKKVDSFVIGLLVGIVIVLIGFKMFIPFDFEYDKESGTIAFNVENEIVSDYETIERRFDEDKGTTFKIYFEKE